MFAEQAQKMVETMAEAFEVTFKRTEEMREQRQVWEVHFTRAVSVRDLLHQNDEKKAKKNPRYTVLIGTSHIHMFISSKQAKECVLVDCHTLCSVE